MRERTGEITFKGNPLTLLGEPVAVGDAMPVFAAIADDLSERSFADVKGDVTIVSSVPSLDTGVCAIQTRTFNERAGSMAGVKVVTISMDLPFAQKRWCAAEGIGNVLTLSDHRDAEFGGKTGLLIEELRLLARAVFVVDRDGNIAYMELVGEMTEEPDYDAALAAAKAALDG